MYITEDFVNTSLFTLVGIEGGDEVAVLDEVSSVTIDTKPLDWCVAAFIAPNSREIRQQNSDNILGKLTDGWSWIDINLNSQGVPKAAWSKKSSGAELPTLGTNTTYFLPTEDVKVKLESLPMRSKTPFYYTSKGVRLKVCGKYNHPYMYYGVSPFLGVGTEIPNDLSQAVFSKLCTLLDNPTGIHLIVLGDYAKAQSIFESGFWGLRQFMVDYYELRPSDISTPLSTPIPFKYSVHTEAPDLGILMGRDASMENYSYEAKEICTFESKAINTMLDLMWSMLYFDYAYIGADPVEQDCHVAKCWAVLGKVYSDPIPFNNPALVLLISIYNEQWRDSSYGSYPPDEDVTATVISKTFLRGYKQAQCFIEHKSPYFQCFSNMASYTKAFAIAIYRRTCSKEHIIMPSGKLYPKRTETRRAIAARHKWFMTNRSLTTYIKVFRHLWEKVLWCELDSGLRGTTEAFSFLCRNYNLPLSSLLSGSTANEPLEVTISTETLLGLLNDSYDRSSELLSVLYKGIDDLPVIEFSGKGSISNVKEAFAFIFDTYRKQVEHALTQDRYSVIQKESFDRWNFDRLVESSKSFENFIEGVKVRRAWVLEDIPYSQYPKNYMSLKDMIKLWQHTNCEDLHKVLEVLVSMLTGLEVDMPASITKSINYRNRIKQRIGIASIKKKLLDTMAQTEAGSKLGQ